MSLATRIQITESHVLAWPGRTAHQGPALHQNQLLHQERHDNKPGARDTAFNATPLPQGRLTDLYCQSAGLNELRLLVPLLAELSQQNKWVTFVAPPCLPNAAALATAGVDTRKIQVIHARTIRDYWQTLEQALGNGMSSAVLAWPGEEFDDMHRSRLEEAAAKGKTVTILLRQMSGYKTAAFKPSQVASNECGQLSLGF